MNNVLQAISVILSAVGVVFYFIWAARKAGSKPEIGIWFIFQALMRVSFLGALIYIALEFIFL